MRIPKQISERTKLIAAVIFIVLAYGITDYFDSTVSTATVYEVTK